MLTKYSSKKNLFPNWYPLSIYGMNLTATEWLMEILSRFFIYEAFADGSLSRSAAIEEFNSLFIKRDHDFWKTFNSRVTKNPITNISPVRKPLPFQLIFLAQKYCGDEYKEARLWATRLYKEPDKWANPFLLDGIYEKLQDQHDPELIENVIEDGNYYNNVILETGTPIWVDLDYDDETLIHAFKIWLAGRRAELKEIKHKKKIDEKDFAKWTKYKLLEASDLVFWSKVNELGYTDAYIAKKLWPDFIDEIDFVDVTERYRKVTKPLIERVFSEKFIDRFSVQADS